MTEAFYLPDGERFVPTSHARGPWDPNAQHAGPPAALIGRALERCEPRDGFRLARITFEILRPVPLEPLTVSARVVRPGRRVEHLEAALSAGDSEVVRATAWRVRAAEDVPPAGSEPPPEPGPDAIGDWNSELRRVWGGYTAAMEWRFARGDFIEPGPATCWMRMRVPLVAGEEVAPLARVLAAADSGNGISGTVDFREYIYINTELTVHLTRHPVGEWVALDSVTEVATDGIGVTRTRLYDEMGLIGTAGQALLVARR